MNMIVSAKYMYMYIYSAHGDYKDLWKTTPETICDVLVRKIIPSKVAIVCQNKGSWQTISIFYLI